MRNARPIEVGGIRRRIVGTRDVAERMKRMKFRHARRRFGKEQELLRLDFEEDIFWVWGLNCFRI